METKKAFDRMNRIDRIKHWKTSDECLDIQSDPILLLLSILSKSALPSPCLRVSVCSVCSVIIRYSPVGAVECRR
jgi:ferredoxin